jgi:glycosyltransferase involved in cell wall biosynthesis|tara:strand:- start:218 stop:1399 length:1182 start_codon:yes stop_codon:yes gene_type:complete
MGVKKKIKILRIINRFNIGGPTYNATFLTKFMSDEFETLLIGGLPEENEANSLHILKAYGVEPLLIPELKREPNLKSDRLALKKIKTIIQEFKPDIVHTHASKAGAIGRKAAFSCNVPVVLHTFHGHVFHSYFGKIKTSIFKNIERYLAKRSTGIIAISSLQKNELCEEHKITTSKKIEVIPLGFDLQKFQDNYPENRIDVRKEHDISEDTIAICITGRLAPVKDHFFFLDVIEELVTLTDRKIKIFIVGDGELRTEINTRVGLLQKKGVNIVMTSWVFDISRFNAGMDIMCLTSKNEGTPVSLIEAQASNLPVISTDVGGVSDIVSQNETGFIISRKDKREFVKKLKTLVEDDELRNKMKTKGWEHVHLKFSYKRLASDMESYYKKLLNQLD